VTVATISKRFSFQASHQLMHHSGACSRLHGHSYEVEVYAEGAISNQEGASDEGMVVDFATISDVWRVVIEPRLDHQHLNHSIGHELPGPTTAENIAVWLLNEFRPLVPQVNSVIVKETATSSAQVYATS